MIWSGADDRNPINGTKDSINSPCEFDNLGPFNLPYGVANCTRNKECRMIRVTKKVALKV